MIDQQLQVLGSPPAADGVGSSSLGSAPAASRSFTCSEPLVVERVGEDDRLRVAAVFEDEPQDLRVARLGRVVGRFAVVGVRARFEQGLVSSALWITPAAP